MSTSDRGTAIVTGAGTHLLRPALPQQPVSDTCICDGPAAQGIGREIALRLARDGFAVAVNDVPAKADKLARVVEEIRATGRPASAYAADVSADAEVKAMVEQVVQEYGGLDVMVANAGICKAILFSQVTVEEWDTIMAVNARGAFLCYKYAGLQMVQQGRGGRIIGACSVAGKRAGSSLMGPYSASKFAIRGLTQAAALEFGAHGITVNTYAPGAVDTEMMAAVNASSAQVMGTSYSERVKNSGALAQYGYLTSILPVPNKARSRVLRRVPKDIADLVSFLASKESGFITGQSISINGGVFFD
ncbi:unnamed protein product [Mycena citricolor]|uniref:NAD(P)-binding protein n=1 Tax=Mycena citricolor TaxID=2018698 RepID=A0AAD2K3F2_9AGAR|nr:unnamed protein product [Mycena citricolor]CAK5274144.1 unnamed protein product [Mycena citricolor]CAK5276713.1 unnamed protein product [Mycena citricolor]